MRKSEIRKAVFRIIEKYADIKIKEDTALRDDAGLDSLDQVEICMDIESEFNIIVEDAKLYSQEVENATAEDVVNMVIEKLKESEEMADEESDEKSDEQPDKTSVQETKPEASNKDGDLKSIAKEYLFSKAKVWCHDRNRWETDSLTMQPNGDFVDEKCRLHCKENHTAYVTLDDAIEAAGITLAKLLENKEWELEKLKQDAFLTEKLRELSDEDDAFDSIVLGLYLS